MWELNEIFHQALSQKHGKYILIYTKYISKVGLNGMSYVDEYDNNDEEKRIWSIW